MAEPNSRCFQACTNCRKRKTKCVGSNPCGRCIKHGLTCSYSVPKKYSRNRKSQQKPLNQDIKTFNRPETGVIKRGEMRNDLAAATDTGAYCTVHYFSRQTASEINAFYTYSTSLGQSRECNRQI